MADDRLAKISRIARIQRRLHQLAEMKVAGLDRDRAELETGQKSLIRALNDDQALQGLFVEAMARRLKILARETDRVNRAREAARLRMVDAGLKLQRAERLRDNAERRQMDEATKAGFADLLDTLVRGGNDASLP